MAYFSMQQRRYKEKETKRRKVDETGLVHLSITHSRNKKPVNTVNTVIAGLLLSVSIFTAVAPTAVYADTYTGTNTTQITQSVSVESASLKEVHNAANAIRTAIKTGAVTRQQLQTLLFSLSSLENDLNARRITSAGELLDALTNITVLSEQLESVNDALLTKTITDITLKSGSVMNQAVKLNMVAFENGDITANHNGVKISLSSLRPKYALGAVKETSAPAQVMSSTPVITQGAFTNFKKVNPYTAQTFKDFKQTDWYAPFVQYAYETGIIAGKGGGNFDPQGNLTIAEAITLASKVNKVYSGEQPVFESGGANWYDNIVKYAVSKGMITSTEFAGKYGQQATRAQMVYIFSKALPADTFKVINTNINIPDVDGRTTYSDKIQMFYAAGIVTGSDSAGSFKPTANISRAEAATIINKIVQPSARTLKVASVVAPLESTAKVPWKVGTVKVQVSIDLNGNPVYRNVEQGATLIKKGTLVAQDLRATEDFYVMYGSHTYGSISQAQYNDVIDLVKGAINSVEFINIKTLPVYETTLLPYVNGTLNEKAKAEFERFYTKDQLQVLKEGKVEEFIQINYIPAILTKVTEVRHNAPKVPGLSPESAYGYIFSNGGLDCNGAAQLYLALFDSLNYNALIVLQPTHAWTMVHFDDVMPDAGFVDMHMQPNMFAAKGIVVKPTRDIEGIVTAGDYFNRYYDMSKFQE